MTRRADSDVGRAATVVQSVDALFGPSTVPVAAARRSDGHLEILGANDAFRRLLGRDDVIGLDLASLAGPDDLAFGSEMVEHIRYGQLDLVGQRHNYHRGDGTTITVQVFSIVLEATDCGVLVVDFFVDVGRMDALTRRFHHDAESAAALAEVRGALLRGESTDRVLELICAWTRRLVGADNAGILQVVPNGRVRLAATDRTLSKARGHSWPIINDEFGRALESGAGARYTVPPELIVAAGAEEPLSLTEPGTLYMAVAPITASGVRFGAILVRRAVSEFDDTDMAVLEMFADGVSDALTVADHRADLERLRVLELRQEIARNLHDEVIQDLIGIRLAMLSLAPDASDVATAIRLASLRDDLDAATMRLRDVVAGLEDETSPAEFGEVLRALVRSRAQRQHIGWTVDLDGPLEDIGEDLRAIVLRVVNEAVSNVVQHADATQVDVTLCVADDRVCLVVEDDGIGPDGAVGAGGMGLRNLGARAAELDGEFVVGARAEGGTRLVWWVPGSEQA